MPRLPGFSMMPRLISPRCAYTTMLRAISEMAVAMMVRSLPVKPIWAARSRPFCRAATISLSRSTVMWATSCVMGCIVNPGAQHFHAFLEIDRGGDAVERQPELDHRKGDVGLNPDDHGLGAAQPRGLGD